MDFPEDSERRGEPASSLRRRDRAFLLTLVALYVGTRFWRVLTFSVDYEDEYFSILAAKKSLGELLSMVAGDIVHPPLFYILLKPWIALGGVGNFWLGSFPLLFSLATLWPFLALARALGVRPAERNLALALLAGSWYLMFFADFLRMYALLQFLSVCSLWLFVRYLQADSARGRWLLALTAVNLLMVYSHYYGWLVVGAELAWVVLAERRRLVGFGLSALVLGLCFLPWIYAVIDAMSTVEREMQQHLGWLSRPGLNTHLLLFYNQISGFEPFPRSGYLWMLFFLLPVIMWGLFAVVRRREPASRARLFWFLGCFAFLPAVTAFVVSQVLPASVWHPRHLIITVVPYVLLVAIAVLRMRPRAISVALVILVVAWTWTAAAQHARDYRVLDWEALANAMIQVHPEQHSPVPVYAPDAFDALLLKFYLEREGGDGFKVQYVCFRCSQQQKGLDIARGREVAFLKVDDWMLLPGDELWVLFSPADFSSEPDPVTVLTARGYRPTQNFGIAAPYRTVEAVRLSRR